MSKFKVGDKVVLTESGINMWPKHSSNPINTCGCITGFGGHLITVAWGNGTRNSYFESDLTHYGQTLAELNVKAGDVVELLTCKDAYWVGSICSVNSRGNAVAKGRSCFTPEYDELHRRTYRIISRESDTPSWTPCPAGYEPQDNHEVSYCMGVPTHYYATESVLVDVEKRVRFDGRDISRLSNHHNATIRGKTRDGKPVGQWTIDMDADDAEVIED